MECYLMANSSISISLDSWGFVFVTPEDAVILTLPPPICLQSMYGRQLNIVMDGEMMNVTMGYKEYIFNRLCTKMLDTNNYSQLISMIMNNYRRINPMQKI